MNIEKNECMYFDGLGDMELRKVPVSEIKGFVYLIEWGEFVKIGCTKNPVQRFKALARYVEYGDVKTGKLALSVPIEDYFFYENHLHNYFSSYRQQGTELFDISLEDAVEYLEYSISEIKREKKENKNEFLKVPVYALLDKDLTLSDAIVFSAIIDYIDDESKAMSIERIMKKTNLSNYQVRQSIKSLEKNNYITAERRAGKKTIYKQCEVLPPKRQSQKKEKDKKLKSSFDADFDVEEYKVLINNI